MDVCEIRAQVVLFPIAVTKEGMMIMMIVRLVHSRKGPALMSVTDGVCYRRIRRRPAHEEWNASNGKNTMIINWSG